MPAEIGGEERKSSSKEKIGCNDSNLDYELGVVAGEHAVLEMWREKDVPQSVHRATVGQEPFQVFDGPPFATGLPHYGHIMVSIVKDCVMRYKRQSGFFVDPCFGWDCHGLPIEFEIDKLLGIKTPADVEKIGIKKYNEECRQIVMRYEKEWEEIVGRIGRWAEFKNGFKTMHTSYMESVWAVFKMIFQKGLVYKGFRVMPYSTGCTTPLSNFEANSNYKDVDDPSVIVTFPVKDNANLKFLVWTTTPWTLPSNLALCVNPEMDYVKIKNAADDKDESIYILLKSRLPFIKKLIKKYEIVEETQGSSLIGTKYVPIFNFFENLQARPAIFTVFGDSYVSDASGTGVVHQAPYFGADDYRIAIDNGLISKDECVACPIDETGCFTAEVPDYAGQYLKDAEKQILKDLKERKRLFNSSSENHSYPYCWRSNTPLIYKAISSWFINVESITDDLVKANNDVNWVPNHIKDGRFGKWIANAQDWLVSRNRYWGCPMPIWASEDMEEVICIGSIAELKELSGVTVTDLHRDNIDHITIDSKFGKGKLKRIPEVFDCWFESGSLPFASNHFPFDTAKTFDNFFPAKFISEGVDQCRGWFYTLLIISTALFGVAPYKNVVSLGLLMAEDGQKMSKSKKNYPDPKMLIETYGSDAIRMYLMSSPAVHGDSINFRQQDVDEFMKKVVIQIYNSAKFLQTGIETWNMVDSNDSYRFCPDNFKPSNHVIDQWIVSLTNSMAERFHAEMDKFHFYKVIPKIQDFMNNLNNWYIRLCRSRLKGFDKSDDPGKSQKESLDTLSYVLVTVVSLFAPIMPFMTERIYQVLKKCLKISDPKVSVHMTKIPMCNSNFVDLQVESTFAEAQSVINLVRSARDKTGIAVKNPLREAIVFCPDSCARERVQSLQSLIAQDSNVKKLTFINTVQDNKFGIKIIATPNHRQLGGRLKKEFKKVSAALDKIEQADLFRYQSGETIQICGHDILADDLALSYVIKDTKASNFEFQYNDNFLLLLCTEIDNELKFEATMRYFVSHLQQVRKSMKLSISDSINIYFKSLTDDMTRVLDLFKKDIEHAVNGKFIKSHVSESSYQQFALNSEPLMDYVVEIVSNTA